jgi:hypothetical protein
MGDATDKKQQRGGWVAWEACSGRYSVYPADEMRDPECIKMASRQDCDDLIELLRVVRERLP